LGAAEATGLKPGLQQQLFSLRGVETKDEVRVGRGVE
jgi:hypothetical protein